MTGAEESVLEAARRYAEALKQTWSDTADYAALRDAQTELVMAATKLVSDEEWMALREAKYGKRE